MRTCFPHREFAASVLTVIVTAAAPAVAQNGSSFIDAGKSAIRYGVATVMPQATCAGLFSANLPQTTILAADSIAATAEVPAHCRVSGLIAPEIRFEVN